MKAKIYSHTRPAWLRGLCSTLISNGVPDGARIVYRGRNLVAAVTPHTTADEPDSVANDGNAPAEVNVKAFRRAGAVRGAVYGWLRPSKARRSYDYAQRLRSMGINTPEPYAAIELRDRASRLTDSYYLSEQLDSSWREIRYMEQRPDYLPMVKALAEWVAMIHNRGILVKDLSPGNILCRTTDRGGYEFALVDLNRMAFKNHDRRHQLYRAGWLMNSEASSVDFARHYALAARLDPEWAVDVVLRSYTALQARAQRKRLLKRLLP